MRQHIISMMTTTLIATVLEDFLVFLSKVESIPVHKRTTNDYTVAMLSPNSLYFSLRHAHARIQVYKAVFEKYHVDHLEI